MTKKRRLYPGELWWEALCDFRNELHEHVEKAKKDQLRFQDGRLLRSLIRHVKAKATGKAQWVALFACYQFVTDTSRTLGYDEALRLHGDEMKARGLSSARSFCSRSVSSLDELLFRVRSIASWMEAQESFLMWLVFKEHQQMWRGNMDDRAHTIQAVYLSQLPHNPLARIKRSGTNYEGKPWNAGQWRSILEQAARLTKKKYDCSPLEKWVWWCYPVFKRYGWNRREVLSAASKRGIDFDKEKEGIDKLATFQKYWLRRGLRFAGGKQRQNRTLPLEEFCKGIALPETQKILGSLGGFLFVPK